MQIELDDRHRRDRDGERSACIDPRSDRRVIVLGVEQPLRSLGIPRQERRVDAQSPADVV